MNAFVLFVGLALGLGVVLEALEEVLPVHAPASLSRLLALAAAVGAAYALDYSVFAAAHTGVRTHWLGELATGAALVGTAELVRAAWPARSRRGGSRVA